MGSGLLTSSAINNIGGSPTQYEITVNSTTGITANDHFLAELSDGTDAVYKVLTIDSGTQITVEDSLTEGNGGSEFGDPATGSCAYATPFDASILELTSAPEGSRGWRALVERNFEILAEAVAHKIKESGGTTMTLGAVADGEFLKRSGTTVVGDAGSVATHKDTHKSGGADAFASTDLLEAHIKRILESGGQILTVGAIGDGEYLVRSGTGIAGASPSTSVVTNVVGGRLTPSSSDPLGEESSGVDNLYYLPHNGEFVALYDGSTSWNYHQLPAAGVSFDVSTDNDMDAAGIAVDSNYDVFLYNNASTLELHLKKWTNDSTRATALTFQDGVRVLTGNTAYRYVGTIRTVDVAAAPKIVDHDRRRFIWNMDGRVTRRQTTGESTPTTYSPSATTANRTLNNANYDGFHHEFVVGLSSWAAARLKVLASYTSGTSGHEFYIRLDGNAPGTAEAGYSSVASSSNNDVMVQQGEQVDAGYHYWQAYENLNNVTSQVNLAQYSNFYSETEC